MSATDGRPAMPMSVLMSAHCSPWDTGEWRSAPQTHSGPSCPKKTAAGLPYEKWEVYIWLQAKLGLDAHQTHIGQFSEYMCEQVISLCQQAPAYTSGRAA